MEIFPFGITLFPNEVSKLSFEYRILLLLASVFCGGYLLLRDRTTISRLEEASKRIEEVAEKFSSEFTIQQIFDFLRKKEFVYYAVYVEAQGGKNSVGKALTNRMFIPISPFSPKGNERATTRYLRIDNVPSITGFDSFKKRLENEAGIKIKICILIDLINHVAKKNYFYDKVLTSIEQKPLIKKHIVERAILDRKIDLLDIERLLKNKS